MSYKEEFIGNVKGHFRESVLAASNINSAWQVIDDYFYGVASSLKEEIDNLGDYVEYYKDGETIELSVLGTGLVFVKSPFSIIVKKKYMNSALKWKILEYKNGGVIELTENTPYSFEILDVWLQDVYGDNLEKIK